MSVWEIEIHMLSDGNVYDIFSLWGVAANAAEAGLAAEKTAQEARGNDFIIVKIERLGEVSFVEGSA